MSTCSQPVAPVVAEPMEAPIFYPTQAEWNENPLSYMERVVRPIGEKAGIVKIIPPQNWRPAFCVDASKFTFNTRQQNVTQLECKSRVRALFDLALRKFRFKSGKPMRRGNGLGANKQMNWYLFFAAVLARGITPTKVALEFDARAWEAIKVDLVASDGEEGSALATSYTARDLYQVYLENLHEFHLDLFTREEHALSSGIATPPEEETVEDGVLDLHTSRNKGYDGMRLGASGAKAGLQASMFGQEAADWANSIRLQHNTPDFKTHPRPAFQTLPSTTSSKNNKESVKLTMDMFSTLPVKPEPGKSLWRYFVEDRACFYGTVIACTDRKNDLWKVRYQGVGNKLFDREEEGDDLALSICCGATSEEAKYASTVGVCQICNRAHFPNTFLVCDACEYRYHDACLLSADRAEHNAAQFDWFCPLCLGRVADEEEDEEEEAHLHALRAKYSENLSLITRAIGVKDLAEFGFPDGDSFVLQDYMAWDAQFRKEYGKPEVFASELATEREFWRIASGRTAPNKVDVMYGNDIDTGALGSGFPTRARADKWQALKRLTLAQRQEYDSYANSPWNLNNLPTSEGSLLQLVDGNISGVIVPWLYMGMTFSAFCFHVEDHNFASINYHHKGAPKSWWGCPASGADAFERAAKELASELIEARPDLLQGIVTMFSPEDLCKRGVPMYHLIQRPGEFVVTFPRAYHGGFNHGWNSAEAVNFAGRGWLEFGEQAVTRYAQLHKMPVVAHEALMISIAMWCIKTSTAESFKTALKLLRPFLQMIKQEEERRALAEARVAAATGVKLTWRSAAANTSASGRGQQAVTAGEEEPSPKRLQQKPEEHTRSMMSRLEMLTKAFKGIPQCKTCKRYCSLSHASSSEEGTTYCLDHAPPNSVMISLFSLEMLHDIAQRFCEDKCMAMEHWIERANRLCMGAPQPDAALGEEYAGGPPLALSLANLRAFRVSLEIDTTCTHPLSSSPPPHIAKPSMGAIELLLAMPEVRYLDEYTQVLRIALHQGNAFCNKWANTLSRSTRLELAEMVALDAELAALPVRVPVFIAEEVRTRLEAALDWQARARIALAQSGDSIPEQLRALHSEHVNALHVNVPEWQAIQSRLRATGWNFRAAAFLKKPGSLAQYEQLMQEEDGGIGSCSPERVGMLALLHQSNEVSRRIDIFFLAGQKCTVKEYAAFLHSLGEGEFLLKPMNYLAFERAQAERETWRESAQKFVQLKTKGVTYLEALLAKADELLISSRDETLLALELVRQRRDALQREMNRLFGGGEGSLADALDDSGLVNCAVCQAPPGRVWKMESCSTCSRVFHANDSCGAEHECAHCESEQLRFCYCRTKTEDVELMAQCDECFGWFHASCAGFASKEDMERLASFCCLNCCGKSNDVAAAQSRNMAAYSRGALSSKFSACAKCEQLCCGVGDMHCTRCKRTMHKPCAGVMTAGEEATTLCLDCCSEADVPVTAPHYDHMQREFLCQVGFRAKREELANKQRIFAGQRASFEKVEQCLQEANQGFPNLFPTAAMEEKLLRPVRVWIERATRILSVGAAATASTRDLWALIDDYFAPLLLEPPLTLLEALLAEILSRQVSSSRKDEVLLDANDQALCARRRMSADKSAS